MLLLLTGSVTASPTGESLTSADPAPAMPRAQSAADMSAKQLTTGMTKGTSDSNLLADATQTAQVPVPKPRPRNLPSSASTEASSTSTAADGVTSPLSGAVRVFPVSMPAQQKSPTSPTGEGTNARSSMTSSSPPPKPVPRRDVHTQGHDADTNNTVPAGGSHTAPQVPPVLQPQQQQVPAANRSSAIWYTDSVEAPISAMPSQPEATRPRTLVTASAGTAMPHKPVSPGTGSISKVSPSHHQRQHNGSTPTSPSGAGGGTPVIPQRPGAQVAAPAAGIVTDGPAVPVRRAVGGAVVSIPDGPPPPVPPRRDMVN